MRVLAEPVSRHSGCGADVLRPGWVAEEALCTDRQRPLGDDDDHRLFFQDGFTGSACGDGALYTASPLRAFKNELGVQDPVGFWDPAGFTANGSVQNFKRRRQTELKHGRNFVLATMGHSTPEIAGKLPENFRRPQV